MNRCVHTSHFVEPLLEAKFPAAQAVQDRAPGPARQNNHAKKVNEILHVKRSFNCFLLQSLKVD